MARKIPRKSKRSPKPSTAAPSSRKQPRVEEPPAARKQSFPVVGAGASAGGLEAFTSFLKHLPADSGMAFVLIQHLDPKQPSQLTDLLSKASPMPIEEVQADTAIHPNHVYVIAPAVCLSISGGILRVEPRDAGRNLPIDHFLRSLAIDKGSNAIGIVLSGTASDGTLGLKALKAEGGVTFAQEPSSAKFDGMPRSAIAAGVVDFVLPPPQIAKRIVRLAQHPYVTSRPAQTEEAALETEYERNRIFRLLRTVTGNDFSHYKPPTIGRRIHRRMLLHGSEKLSDYVAYLNENPAEVRALADDLLISVTSFFREPPAYEALSGKVFPRLLQDRSQDDPIRIWIPGCATGEEVYSVAICLAEARERSESGVPVQIFGTDVSEAALEKARTGTYSTPSLADVSPARLKRFFTKTNGGHQIQKAIRETCIFARQNITKDPPFRNLDLISCCNVLIYFGPVLQRKALAIFYYALKPGGVLLLGPSEGVGAMPHAFAALDKKVKLFSKQPGSQPIGIAFPPLEPLSEKEPGPEAAGGNGMTLEVQKAADRILMAQYAPPGVVVDDALNVVQVRGDTGPYLQFPPGQPTFHVLRMAREGLAAGMRSAFLRARRNKAAVTQPVRVKQNGGFKEAQLKVVPLEGAAHSRELHFLVVFEDAASSGAPRALPAEEKKAEGSKPAKATGTRDAGELARLREELAATRDYLQAIIEEQEASTEELKSANEEAQASNEELETAKEELQSTNEELNTVNEELRTRNIALTELNNDLSNVLSGIDLPLVMVGKDLRVRRFTPAIEPMLNFIDSDVGRSISDLKPNIAVSDLASLLESAIHGERPPVREIQGPDGRWYSMAVLPFLAENRIDGALLVLRDIDAVRHGRDYAEAVVQATRQPLLILTRELKITKANEAFYETFRTSQGETENRFLYELGSGEWNLPALRQALENIRPESGFDNFELEQTFGSAGRKMLVLSGREIRQPAPYGETLLLAIEDVTERVEHQRLVLLKQEQALAAEKKKRELESELARVVRALTVGELATSIAHEVNQPLAAVVTNAEACLRWLRGENPNLQEARESLEMIVRDGHRAGEVIHQIRRFLKPDDREKTVFDVNEVMQQAIDFAKPELLRSRVKLRVELSRGLPQVGGNRVQLEQVILNLIMNSRDAMATVAEGSRELRLSTRESGGTQDGAVLVAVEDSGVGLKPKDLERIFDAFFTTKPGGMGLGLSISRSIVEAHGGRIWAEAKDGPGVTVQFTLPAAAGMTS